MRRSAGSRDPANSGSSWWDRIPRLHLSILGHRLRTARVMWCAAALVGAIAFALRAPDAGLPPAIVAAVVLVELVGFFAVTWVRVRVTGARAVVMLEQTLVAGGLAAAALIATGAPLGPGLAAWTGAMPFLLGVGRLSCLMTGCCYGRPCRVGIAYPWRQARREENAPTPVRLVPVQAMESGLLFAIGVLNAIAPLRPTAAIALMIASYAAGRFALELWRGDARWYHWRLSYAQWLSIGLVAGATIAWPLAAIAGVVMAGTAWRARARLGPPPVTRRAARDYTLTFTR